MWDFFETVRHRHSVRQYQSDIGIEREKLNAILEMACAAPSAGDLQSYKIFVVEDVDKRLALSQAAENQKFIAQAPVCLIFCADYVRSSKVYGERGEKLYAIQDATIAASYAQLAIVAAGMASTWVGYFSEEAVAEIVCADQGSMPVALLSVGYPAELPEQKPRRRMNEMVSYI